MAYACATRGPARLTSVRKTSAAGRNGARQRVVASSSSTATATLVEAKRIYEAAFASLPHSRCMQLAQGSSKRNEQNDEWFYGELDFSTFAALLSNLSPGGTGGESFVDLGSGAGKAVAVAALTQAYKSCIGVELLPELHAEATAAQEKVLALATESHHVNLPCTYELREGNMFAHDCRNADILYCHATCLGRETMQLLGWQLEEQLKPGARVVIMSKSLNSSLFEPYGPGVISMPQGHSEATLDCYLYVKL
ncbi:histone-lysine N-methyltransferase [Pseudoscourfieldia marina]|mmetsp:Transcript_5132/g.11435  ORF Transcript_5132/g.11435 Transcript_5132/m.11435 type:complete len:252 (+) Transcript_5132:1-756(+)